MQSHESERTRPRRLAAFSTDLIVLLLGTSIALIGDACHVASGLTRYTWPGVPTVWRSAIWFPPLVGGAVLAVARVGELAGLPRTPRSRLDSLRAVAAVLALYALTAVLRGQPTVVAVVLCGALGVVIWSSWDPSLGALALACACAIVGPLSEIGFVALGGVRYAEDSQALGGVAPSLPCLYFAAAAVASGLRRPLAGGGNWPATGGV